MRSSGGQHSKFLFDKRLSKSRKKIFDGNYRLATGRSSGLQGKNKQKGNLFRHVFSIYYFFRWSEEILAIPERFKIPLPKNPTQEKPSQTPHMGQEQVALINVEIENILKNGATQQTG